MRVRIEFPDPTGKFLRHLRINLRRVQKSGLEHGREYEVGFVLDFVMARNSARAFDHRVDKPFHLLIGRVESPGLLQARWRVGDEKGLHMADSVVAEGLVQVEEPRPVIGRIVFPVPHRPETPVAIMAHPGHSDAAAGVVFAVVESEHGILFDGMRRCGDNERN
ncbi:hypothetical protein SDC9_185263 [bioreactor metagenome]|uniref:Uncharacterized protein n=1 Tax=bioreactor metagenome TaxID=1076179 RepID=A0A645HH82_9ZZZZ